MLKKVSVLLVIFLSSCGYFRDVDQALLEDKGPSIIKITGSNHACTGFAMRGKSRKKIIVTNAHCADLDKETGFITYESPNGKNSYLRVLYRSPTTDLAVLDGIDELEPLHLANEFNVNQKLHVVGHPLGNDNTYSGGFAIKEEDVLLLDDSKTCNLPKQTSILIPTLEGAQMICITKIHAFDTSIVIYPGNSGSPVFESSGEYVVGVMFAGNTITNFGEMIPLNDLREVINLF